MGNIATVQRVDLTEDGEHIRVYVEGKDAGYVKPAKHARRYTVGSEVELIDDIRPVSRRKA
jgi:ribosome-binding factor A